MQLVAMQRTVEQTEALIRDINTSGVAELGLLPLDQITGTTILERLEAGENVSLEDSEGHRYLYQKLSGEPWVLVVEQTVPHSLWLERLLAVLFYTALAIAVGFWLWPLSRDLDTLERHAQHLGIDADYPTVTLPPSSTAHRLAQAFNRMTTRIRELLQTQKEMTHAVSHELRTPLARMKFALAMAADSRSLDEIHGKLEGMKSDVAEIDRKSTRLNSSHVAISYAVFCLK